MNPAEIYIENKNLLKIPTLDELLDRILDLELQNSVDYIDKRQKQQIWKTVEDCKDEVIAYMGERQWSAWSSFGLFGIEGEARVFNYGMLACEDFINNRRGAVPDRVWNIVNNARLLKVARDIRMLEVH